MAVIATAAWSIAKTAADRFPSEGSGLTRYASVFKGVEINSTFYRRHKEATFARWGASVPEDFQFSLKMPKEITHVSAMVAIREPFEVFLRDIAPLGEKRGPLLCQLPPSVPFHRGQFEIAFSEMRALDKGIMVIEARHGSWNCEAALALLREHSIGRVFADPAPVWPFESFNGSFPYVRLHGTPRIYYSSYTEAEIAAFSKILGPESWCVFDNTASGAAAENALTMLGIASEQAGD